MICPKGLPAPLISIHAPRTGSDPTPAMNSWKAAYFNPRSPHGERLLRVVQKLNVLRISIRAPRTGSDAQVLKGVMPLGEFQSTLPARGATAVLSGGKRQQRISIHAPRTGSDAPKMMCCIQRPYFNPRSPHGERRR